MIGAANHILGLATEYSKLSTDALGQSERVMRAVDKLNDADVIEFCHKLMASCPEMFPS